MPLSSRFSHSTSSRKDTIVKTKRLSLSKSSINVCMLSPIVILFRMYLADARPDKSLLTISRSVGSPSYSLVLWCFLSARTPTRYQYLGVLWKSVSFQTNIYSGSIKRTNQASQWKAKKVFESMNQQCSKAKEVVLEISTTSTSGASQAITNSSYERIWILLPYRFNLNRLSDISELSIEGILVAEEKQ